MQSGSYYEGLEDDEDEEDDSGLFDSILSLKSKSSSSKSYSKSYSYTYYSPSSYYNYGYNYGYYGYYSGAGWRAIDWLWFLLIFCCCVPIYCYFKMKAGA